MRRFLLPTAVAVGILSALCGMPAAASPSSESKDSAKPQYSGKIELPSRNDDEFHENFDIRIWPEEVVRWLEQENLRDLIADPNTPEEERKALKMILALQNAWRST